MKILITGSGGMLGAEFLREFSSNTNHEVIGITRSDCDLTDKVATKSLIVSIKPTVVVHCAALVGGIHANIAHPVDFLANNLLLDTSVILGALDAGTSNLIYIGSSCMYPQDYRQPLVESDILAASLEPTNEGYAIAKIAGSRLASFISSEHGLNYKTLIPSNLYGPGDNFSPGSSHLVAATLLKAHNAKLSGVDEIDVWGNGQARREFTYIGDLSSWLAKHLDLISEFPDVLNVGAGMDHSVNDYYESALRVVGHTANLKHDLSKPVGMMQKLMDSTTARNNFNWNPSTNLNTGMKKTYEDFLMNRSKK